MTPQSRLFKEVGSEPVAMAASKVDLTAPSGLARRSYCGPTIVTREL